MSKPGSESAPEWQDLQDRAFPAWFRDAKLGIFIHWGIYSVPSWSGPEQYAEWFLRGLQTGDEPRLEYLRRVYGDDFSYEDLAPHFRAELFNPIDWADLFQASGARYVVLTSKHHDGFALWPSEHASAARGFAWNSMETGPKRDLVGELTEAVRANGLRMGLYYSLPEWNHPIYSWGSNKPGNDVDRYVSEHMIPQFKDVMSRYKPAVIFSDGEWDHPASTWHSAELLRWLFTESGCPPDLAVNDRWGGGSKIGFRTPEYSAGAPPGDRPWAECRGLGRSFGLNRNEKLDAYLTPKELVHFFARAVSHGGGMLLNVGPGADGQIPLLQQERLRQLGSWIAINEEAIYAAETWQQLGEWTTHKVERIDSRIDFDWVRNAPASEVSPDHFQVTWEGYLETNADGAYMIRLEADDRATVWIDGEKIATESEAGLIYLGAGDRRALKVVFEEEQHQAVCRLFWTHEDGLEGVIPGSALFLNKTGEELGLRASFESQRQTIAFTRKGQKLYAIVFDWPGKRLRFQAPEPPADSDVRLLGLERELEWRWQDGVLEINTSDIGINDLPCAWAWAFRIILKPGY